MLFDKKDSTVRMYGTIGDEISAEMFIGMLDEAGGEDLTIRLQSPGGDVIEGLSIYNQIRSYGPGKITIEVDVLAASIASVIMLAADEVFASPNARVMIHRAWTLAFGNSKDFFDLAELLSSWDHTIAKAYQKKAGGDLETWFEKMDAETWYDAEQAETIGLIDGILQESDDEDGVSAKTFAAISPQKPLSKVTRNTLKNASPQLKTWIAAAKLRERLLDNGSLDR